MKNKMLHIGIPAHNEEKNIGKLLTSIGRQKGDFIIKKITIIIDGSTDNTEKEIKKIKDQRINIINDKKRLGKTARINQLFSINSEEIIVTLDADIILNDNAIQELIKPFSKDSKVGLVGGRLIPQNNNTFIEKAINITVRVYEQYTARVNNGSNVYAVKGAIMAVRNTLAKKIKLPKDIFAEDTYIYFCCIKQGYKFIYAQSAIAQYKIPSTIKDQIEQNTRFIGGKDNIQKYFGNVVIKERLQKKNLLLILMVKAFIKNPVYTTTIFIINQYARIRALRYQKKKNVKWKTIQTTKSK